MHLAIDAIGAKTGGAAMILHSILEAALEDSRISRVTLFCSPLKSLRFELPYSAKLVILEQSWPESNRFIYPIWYKILLERQCRKIEADIVYCLSNVGHIRDRPYIVLQQQALFFSPEGLARVSRNSKYKLVALRLLAKHSCLHAARVIVQTETMARSVANSFGVPRDRLAIIPTPVRLPNPSHLQSPNLLFTSSPDQHQFLSVGHVSGYKMLPTMIDGWAVVHKVFPEARLLLAGANKVRCEPPGVRVLGFLDRNQLSIACHSSSVMVSASLAESFGIPLFEAMSIGKPILVADRPYARNIVQDAGLYFDPFSPNDFAQKAVDLIHSASARQLLGNRGREIAENIWQQKPYARMMDILWENH